MAKKRILIIDDDLNTIQVLEKALRQAGYDTISAEDGEKGLELTFQEKPYLVVSDVLLPGLDGYQVCQRIKSDPNYAHIPVILLTAAYFQDEERDHGLRIGGDRLITKFDALLDKPVDPRLLLEHVKVLLKETPPEKALYRVVPKLLVVDDDETNRMLVGDIFEDAPYEIFCAEDGAEGLALFRKIDPEIVLLDNLMPRLNGLDFLTEIQEAESRSSVVFMTAHGSEDVAVEAMKRGASDYVKKPLNVLTLPVIIEENLNKYRLQLRQENLTEQLKATTADLFQRLESLEKSYTRLREAQEMIVKAERLHAINEVTITLAHEINNSLQSIMGSAETMAIDDYVSETHEESLERIFTGSDRIVETIKKLKELQDARVTDYTEDKKMIDINST